MSEAASTVAIEATAKHVTTIRLSRPERLNAISFELVADLHDALDAVARDPSCKVVILTGAGRGFCSGLDLKQFGRPPAVGTHPHRRVGIDAQTFMSNLTVRLRDLPAVVIAAVNGVAFGGGLALACAADIRIASPAARFCSAFIRTGLSGTDIGITYLLPRLIGNAHAFDLILTGREIDAAEALRIGLVSAVSPEGDVERLALAYASTMAGYTSSGLRTTKEVLWQNSGAVSLEAALALEIRNQNLLQHDPEVREFMNSYRRATTGVSEEQPR
jgi:enoyl-CoA hydratase